MENIFFSINYNTVAMSFKYVHRSCLSFHLHLTYTQVLVRVLGRPTLLTRQDRVWIVSFYTTYIYPDIFTVISKDPSLELTPIISFAVGHLRSTDTLRMQRVHIRHVTLKRQPVNVGHIYSLDSSTRTTCM